MVTIETADIRAVDGVTDMWVTLAAGQREFGSHVLASDNRTAIRESVARHVVGDSLLIARDDGLIGFVMFTVESGTFEQDCIRGVIENLFVVPERRDDGVGTALLDAAERTLWDRGVGVVALDVMADNRQAREFYRQHGYDPHRIELEKSGENDTHSKGDRQ